MACVLVVEDDPMLRESLAMLLKYDGFTVMVAEHGLDALQRLEQEPEAPCIIVLDLMMPVMDGIAFRAEQLKRDDLANIPVIITTGHDDAESVARATKACALLRKPFKPQQIIDLVRTHCG